MNPTAPVFSIVMAAGRGSRMQGYAGNKTLLPLIAAQDPFQGTRPILVHVLENLPPGTKALIVHHCQADVENATRDMGVVYCRQPALNGTGGALLAAGDFIDQQPAAACCIITMGDVPFVQAATYERLVQELGSADMVILGFAPRDKKKYGVLEIEDGEVRKITEWQYWKDYPSERQARLTICNSGIYAVHQKTLAHYLPILASRPQVVYKEIDGKNTAIEEFFITDLIEYMVADGHKVGYLVAGEEMETMGVDDLDALTRAQAFYKNQTEG